ncbi:MAG: cation-translocating P-type ATPase [Hyphomonadaceae bacterium]|nr:cation-translocating P-type ATPase [Hyphomonadaceae bacterium]
MSQSPTEPLRSALAAPADGLSQAEAARLLEQVGPNEVAAKRTRSVLDIIAETGREPMFLLMLGAALLYVFVGDIGEGLFLSVAALVAAGLVVAQEARSERALAALRQLAQPTVRVMRDGAERRLPARELVPGDVILVTEGDRLPADAMLIGGDMLSVDEAVLTGESAPVTKRLAAPGASPNPDVAPGDDASVYLFAGGLIVRGHGVARVTRTGANSEIGRIGASLAQIAHMPTPLQQRAAKVVGLLGLVAFAFCGVVALAYGLLRHDWFSGLLAGITVAISLVPEEFPMVLAVFLAVGAWRLARHRVLVRRSAVIESLGAASVLCVDKTGTLTENRMQVARLWLQATGQETAPSEAEDLLTVARRASAAHPVDPMDRAIDALAPLANASAPSRTWPLRPDRMVVVQAWEDGKDWLLAAKGAPEAVIALCGMHDGATQPAIHDALAAFGRDGLRVLGIARATTDAMIDDPSAVRFEFLGLIAFRDPLRPAVPAALAEARGAGVKVAMITGDHPATARAAAEAAGINVSAGVLTGREIGELPFPTLCERLRDVRVFARVAPQQKLLLVEAFKANGEVVAMTGDGVNDAPALEAADIGIAMGQRGADVAREAADLILLDDSFASIVGGIRLGRRIFNNLRNALTYITAIHVPIAGLALLPIVLGMPPLLLPMHVVLLELAIDPTCALVFEAERGEARAMTRPPRPRDEPLFGVRHLTVALAQGAGLLALVLGLYAWLLQVAPEPEARGAAFIGLTLGNLALALTDSLSGASLFAPHRRVFWIIVLAVSTAMTLVMLVPPLAAMFGVSPSHWVWTGTAVAVLGGVWGGALRVLQTRSGGSPAAEV